MKLPECTVLLLALSVSVAPCSSQKNQDPLDERLRRADALQDKGALRESREIYQSVATALETSAPSPQLAHALNGLSNVATSEGSYDQAVAYAQQADVVYKKLGDAKGQAYALNSQGIAEGELGRYAQAQSTFHQALALTRNTGDLETTVRTLNNLGNAHYFPGDYLEALRCYEEAGQILEHHRTAPWSASWSDITYINQATLYQRLGRYQKALDIYQFVGAGSNNLSASDRAHLQTNLGALYRRLGDSWKALESYQTALSLYSKQRDVDGEISVLKNIGIVYALDQEDLAHAEQMFRRALSRAVETRNQREEMQAHLYLGETFLRKRLPRAALDEFQLALAQAKKLDTREEQWKALYGKGQIAELLGESEKAEVDFREAIAIIETTRTKLQLSLLRAEFLADKREAYDALISLLLNKNAVGDAFTFLERSRARNFQDRFSSNNSGSGAAGASLSLDEVRSHLDDSTVLVEFWVSGDRLAWIWCTHESYGMAQKQFSAESLRSLLDFLKGLPRTLDGNWPRRAAILGEVFPGDLPVASQIQRVVIVPDGWVGAVPFDLAPAGQNSSALFIDRFEVSYLPTALLLRRTGLRRGTVHFPWVPQLVGFGDPIVATPRSNTEEFEGRVNLQRLPYSGEEIRSIAKVTAGRVELFLQAADTKSSFLSKANSAPILHVSTHAFADADNPEGSRIMFSADAQTGPPAYVFLRELYDLDLTRVDLATLSACDTERGKMIRGEGIQAFSRAVLFAGSRSALTTLWRVDDQPTKEFMQQFYYFALQKRQSKAHALRSAKLKFLHSDTTLANPANWAAFVLNGNGVEAVPAFISWAEIVAVMAGVILLTLSGALWFRLRASWRDRSGPPSSAHHPPTDLTFGPPARR